MRKIRRINYDPTLTGSRVQQMSRATLWNSTRLVSESGPSDYGPTAVATKSSAVTEEKNQKSSHPTCSHAQGIKAQWTPADISRLESNQHVSKKAGQMSITQNADSHLDISDLTHRISKGG